jgi:hypothetical protein
LSLVISTQAFHYVGKKTEIFIFFPTFSGTIVLGSKRSGAGGERESAEMKAEVV